VATVVAGLPTAAAITASVLPTPAAVVRHAGAGLAEQLAGLESRSRRLTG
jgi:hypothetical protein